EASLRSIETDLAPALRSALQRTDGIQLKPLIARALRMGDEMHSRNTAATILFARELMAPLLDIAAEQDSAAARSVLDSLSASDYFFLRLAMAAAKATADSARDIPASSVVTAMVISCRSFALRVSGLGDTWVHGPLPNVDCKLFDGFTEDDIEWIGGES